jgi:hypothetical protein
MKRSRGRCALPVAYEHLNLKIPKNSQAALMTQEKLEPLQPSLL